VNPLYLLNAWSFRKEIIFVSISFLIVLSMPFIAVLILTHTGINIVSDKLVSIDKQSKAIQIHDPKSGIVIKTVTTQLAWPTTGVITLEFGESNLPYQPFHTGIDIANSMHKQEDPISPIMKGKVTYAGEIFWGYGKHIIIDHGDNITSVYAHLSKIFVYPGQVVNIGDTIGLEGTSGWSTGPHLHLEVRVFGIPVNPRTFLGI